MSNYVSCISQSVYNDYWSLVKRLKGIRMKVIVNAIDYRRLDDSICDMPHHSKIYDIHKLICVDRIIPLKNQSFLVKLMKMLPDSQLIIVGEEDTRKRLRQLAISEGVDSRVVFTGLMPREQVYREMNMCGLYVSASKIEGLHNSVIEAMGVGNIPIISDIPAHCEIAHAIGLIDTFDFDLNRWANIIRYYQEMKESDFIKLSNELRTLVRERFSLIEMHNQFDDIYHLLAK